MKTSFIRTLFCVVGACGLICGSQTILGQSVSFSTNSYATGSNPFSVIAADVFGTGRPAIITANQNDGTLTVLGNFGNGIFASNATYNVNGSTRSVVAADVNLDGKLDLIAIGVSTTLVLTNYNFGSFGSNATINAGGYCAVTFDLNNDGKPDLLIGGNSSVVIFTNNGSGRFGWNAALTMPGPVISMAVADVNFDGRPDLIVPNYNYASLTVFTNNGNGLLVSNATYAVGNYPRSVAAADINGDGKVDLIAANYGDATLTILTNNGIGIFGSNATLNVARGCFGVVAADFNGEGLIDLVAFDSLDRPGIVSVVTNSSAGFGTYFTVVAGEEPQAMAMADFNGDNKPDLVLGNSAASVTVLLNSTLFASPPLNIFTAGNRSVLYWSSPAPNSVLQSTTNLNNPNWVTVSNGTPIIGVTLPNTSPSQFYRLKSQ